MTARRCVPLVALFLVLALASRATAQVDAVLSAKGSYAGALDPGSAEVVLRTEALDGSLLTVVVKAKDGLIPEVVVTDLASGTDLDLSAHASGVGTTKLKVVKLPLLGTGLYEMRITGAAGTTGSFKLTSKVKLPPSAKKIVVALDASASTGPLVTFDAMPGTVLSGSVKLQGVANTGLPGLVLDGPLGNVDLSGKVTANGKGVTLKPVGLPSLGAYRLALEQPVAQGTLKVTLKLKSPKAAGAGKPSALFEVAAGHLELPAAASSLAGQLEVLTLVGSADVPASGDFVVEAPPASTLQPLIFREKNCGKPIFLGLRDPTTGVVEANVESTATALLLFNPYLLYADQAQRQVYLADAQASSEFADLLVKLQAAYAGDPCTALDLDAHPEVYTALAQAMVAALEAAGPSPPPADGSLGDPPFIIDAPGAAITVVNPRHVFYAIARAGIDGVFVGAQKVDRKEAIVVWKWPFEFSLDPAETQYVIGDGSFELWVTRGSLDKLLNMADPEGLAATLNLAQGAIYLIEMVSGYLPDIPLEKLPYYIEIPGESVVAFELAVLNQSPMDFIQGVVALLEHNIDGIALWILESAQEGAGDAAAEFIDLAGGVLKNVSFALKVLEAVNEQGPFFWDWAFAPKEVTYHVTQAGGVITSTQANTAPVVALSADPPAGILGTMFQLDASGTLDDADALGQLEFQWDFEADGAWDTTWQSSPFETYVYDTAGAKTVIAAARDLGGLIGFGTAIVNVGGGAGTASHVKLFRDALPWDTNATVNALSALGFTTGSGPGTYEILPSTQMDSATLIPGEDLIVISNDQPQAFYDNYADAHLRFVQFVQNGGALFWGACDLGWKGGSMSSAGIVLPGGVVPSYSYQNWNYVVAPDLPLMAGLPTAMDHNYASHERFTNLPPGTTTYMVDGSGLPTLIEFSLGLGWVVVTGQPLEHQATYVYGAPDMAVLLPAVLAYFTGVGPQPPGPALISGGAGPPSVPLEVPTR